MTIRIALLMGGLWLMAIVVYAQGNRLGAEAQGAKDGQAQIIQPSRVDQSAMSAMSSLPFANIAPEAFPPKAIYAAPFYAAARTPAPPRPQGFWLEILPVTVAIAAIWVMFLILGLTVGGVFLFLMGITAVFGILALAAVVLALVDLVNGRSGGSRWFGR